MKKPFDPQRFIDIAYELGEQTQSEAYLRVAVGRAYYGLHLLARERLGVRRGHSEKEKVLWALTRQDFAAKGKLLSLLRLREEADYNLVQKKPEYQDWLQNWVRAKGYVEDILPKIQALRSKL